ncbi:MAG TPA: PIN domain-containing protein [Candidatus Baltobacteraceae bacterium]
MGLIDDLGDGLLAVDTSPFIYFVEEHPRYVPVVDELFEAVARSDRRIVTSSLTLLELLVVPYRTGDLALAARYEALLTRTRGVRLAHLTLPVLRTAARLRAAAKVKTADAIQLATAKTAGCSVFLTNDARIPAVPGLRIVMLDAYC